MAKKSKKSVNLDDERQRAQKSTPYKPKSPVFPVRLVEETFWYFNREEMTRMVRSAFARKIQDMKNRGIEPKYKPKDKK